MKPFDDRHDLPAVSSSYQRRFTSITTHEAMDIQGGFWAIAAKSIQIAHPDPDGDPAKSLVAVFDPDPTPWISNIGLKGLGGFRFG